MAYVKFILKKLVIHVVHTFFWSSRKYFTPQKFFITLIFRGTGLCKRLRIHIIVKGMVYTKIEGSKSSHAEVHSS